MCHSTTRLIRFIPYSSPSRSSGKRRTANSEQSAGTSQPFLPLFPKLVGQFLFPVIYSLLSVILQPRRHSEYSHSIIRSATDCCSLHVTLTSRAMRILDRYIVREVVRHAFLGLIIFTFVLFVPKLVRLMELFVRHSGSGSQILTLFVCIIPGILVFTIPMAVLIGVLLGLS